MAQAQVVIKVTPNELQVIDKALEMYTYACRNMNRDDRNHPLDGFKINLAFAGNDPRKAAIVASKIKQDIGLL